MRATIEIEFGARPSTTEMEVVEILVENQIARDCVKFLKPSRTKGAKTPDLLMDEVYWEIKSIDKLGKYTLEHALRSGLRQAGNLIIDLRRLNVNLEKKAIKSIEQEFLKRNSWKGLVAIVRYDKKCLTFNK